MTRNSILVLTGILLILGFGVMVYAQKNLALYGNFTGPGNEDGTTEQENDSPAPFPSDGEDEDEAEFEDDEGATPPASGDNTVISSHGFTMAEVAMHSSAQSCWSAINGNVYDLTSWIPNHPGGPDKILQLCGTDGSAKFNGQHGGSPQQATVLAGFKIGVLVN